MPGRHKKVFLIGGDLRLVKTAEGLSRYGFEIITYAADVGGYDIETVKSLDEGIKRSDIIVLGLPITRDGLTVYAPFYKGEIYLDDLAEKIDNQIVLGGMVSDGLAKKFDDRNIRFIDYLKREELAVANAVPTALWI